MIYDFIKVILVLSISLSLSCSEFSKPLKVRLRHGGGVYGRYITSNSGKAVKAFRGIPYAEPPIGNLRFSDPVEKSGWSGYIDGEQNRVSCIQIDTFMRNFQVQGQEDCLYLNVFVPRSPRTKKLLPVMFYIHGGGFMSGNMNIYGPDLLMDHDVIYVAGNYRLGALGFLSTLSKDLPGNLGMKDQVMMLKWIQKNIYRFGGDPDKVTIFGQSAGSVSASLHMISPLSRGYFHKAILQSGNYYDTWATRNLKTAKENAKKLFNLLNCPYSETNESEGISCLRSKSAEDITKQVWEYLNWDTDFPIPFAPVIEERESKTQFLNKEMLRRGPDPNVPIIIGMNTHELTIRLAQIYTSDTLVQELNSDILKILPYSAGYYHLPELNKTALTQRLMENYLSKTTFNFDNDRFKLTDLLTDAWILSGLNDFLTKRFDVSRKHDTFVYLFNYEGEASFVHVLGPRMDELNFGVSHGDDLLYLFPLVKDFLNHKLPTNDDLEMQEKMVEMWVNFAKNGKPSEKWDRAREFPLEYFRIGLNSITSSDLRDKTKMSMKKGLFTQRSLFWKTIEL